MTRECPNCAMITLTDQGEGWWYCRQCDYGEWEEEYCEM